MGHRMIGRLAGALVAVTLLALALPVPLPAQAPRKVTFVFPTPVMDLRYSPASVGIELGFFKEEGIEPAFQTLAGSAAAIQAVMAGQVDALALWDTQYAGIENLGTKFRYFVHPPLANLSSGGLFSRDE